LNLMRECIANSYKIQEENIVVEGGVTYYNNPRGFSQGGKGGFNIGRGRGRFCRGGRGPIICYNCN